MDHSSQKEDSFSSSEGLTEVKTKRCCSDCKTTKTPLWRSGPSGPKSMCNACGIRYKKKRRPDNTPDEMRKGKIVKGRVKTTTMMTSLGKEMEVMRKQRSSVSRQWDDVERAALLLMALSCGAIFY